jgi:hypothetical protein
MSEKAGDSKGKGQRAKPDLTIKAPVSEGVQEVRATFDFDLVNSSWQLSSLDGSEH